MKILKEAQFAGAKAVMVGNAEDGRHQASVGELLVSLLELYQPGPNASLTNVEARRLGKAWDVLEAGAKDGTFTFEDADWDVLKRTVLGILPRIATPGFVRNVPLIEDLLNEVG